MSDLISDVSLSDEHRSAAVEEKLESSVQSLQLLDISDVDAGKSRPESETESQDAETPLEASLNRSVAPLCQSSLSVPALPPSYLEVCLGDVPAGEVRFFRSPFFREDRRRTKVRYRDCRVVLNPVTFG